MIEPRLPKAKCPQCSELPEGQVFGDHDHRPLTQEEMQQNAREIANNQKAEEEGYHEPDDEVAPTTTKGSRGVGFTISSYKTHVDGDWKRVYSAQIRATNHNEITTHDFHAMFSNIADAYQWAMTRTREILTAQEGEGWDADE